MWKVLQSLACNLSVWCVKRNPIIGATVQYKFLLIGYSKALLHLSLLTSMKLSANHLFGRPVFNKTEIKLRKLEKCSTNACVVALCFQLSSKSYIIFIFQLYYLYLLCFSYQCSIFQSCFQVLFCYSAYD